MEYHLAWIPLEYLALQYLFMIKHENGSNQNICVT